MWARNALFLGLGLIGLASLVGAVLMSEPRPQAADYRPAQFESPDVLAVVADVDGQWRQRWQWAQLEPAARAPDLQIARRLSLGLTGTLPSLEEIRELERRPADQRIAWWVTHLLEDRRYADYMAERFARAMVGDEGGPFLVYRGRRFRLWLSDQFHDNVPYDELARKLIAAEGIWTSHPEVNFVTASFVPNEGPDEVKLAARMSRAFLGVRIDCVQCHDDNLGGDWKQTDFHELAAFFAPAELTLTGVRDKKVAYRYKYLRAEEEVDVPQQVPFAEALLEAPSRDAAHPRQRLARWATKPENRPFARAVVNRMWALLFGKPLEEPIDDIPLEGPYSPGFETLVDDFIQHGYDLQRLIRVIASTEVFQLDSRADHALTEKHERHWASFPLTRLRGDQVAGSILQSASLKTIDAQSHIFVKLQTFDQKNKFIERYGDTGEDEFADKGGTIPQRLLMMNGNMLQE
ncbi:MAG: DUF1549 domain-containing protein, partial [Planctomycetales bacterium]|nr:DUF1549 domain-containing protein [Planctomycetales bacterium]